MLHCKLSEPVDQLPEAITSLSLELEGTETDEEFFIVAGLSLDVHGLMISRYLVHYAVSETTE